MSAGGIIYLVRGPLSLAVQADDETNLDRISRHTAGTVKGHASQEVGFSPEMFSGPPHKFTGPSVHTGGLTREIS
jgi:hypothetical protein